MKASSKRLRVFAFCAMCLLFISGCSQTPKKNTAATTDSDSVSEVQHKAFNASTISQQQYALEDFGPNPFITNAPSVTSEDKKRFNAVIKDIENDDLTAAEEKLLVLVDQLPYYSGPVYNLAIIQSGQGRTEGAIKNLQLALDRNYYNQDARNLLGYLYRQQGDFTRAEKFWLENLTIWGGYAPSYRNLGILYDLYLGRPEQAVGYYKQFNQLQAKPDKLVRAWVADIDRRLAHAEKNKEILQAKAELENVSDDSQKALTNDKDKSGSVQ